jgi:hypothetical protein
MKRTTFPALMAAAALLLLVAAGSFWLGRARADGIATAEALFYAGTVEDGNTPVTGMRSIQIGLWDSATGSTGRRCLTSANIMVASGRFRLPLDPLCTAEVRANPNLYVEPIVGDVVLPRRKLGAVPYAVEAARASEAAGELRDQIKDLQAKVTALAALGNPSQRSAFSATKTTNQTILAEEPCTVIDFQVKDYDLGTEFDLATDRFTAKEAGYYQVTCSLMFGALDKGTSALHSVAIVRNGGCTTDTQVASSSFYGDSFQAAVAATKVVRLAANDYLTCVGYQALTGMPRTIEATAQWSQSRNFFNVVRLF